jgi:hypothetical protein
MHVGANFQVRTSSKRASRTRARITLDDQLLAAQDITPERGRGVRCF